jgi:transposase, IS5 family
MMVGLLILKQMYNLSDEGLIAAWIGNPYYQFFCGEAYFQWEQPCERY